MARGQQLIHDSQLALIPHFFVEPPNDGLVLLGHWDSSIGHSHPISLEISLAFRNRAEEAGDDTAAASLLPSTLPCNPDGWSLHPLLRSAKSAQPCSFSIFVGGVFWRAHTEARISLRVWHHELPSVRPLVLCINEYPFSRFAILNHVLARPYLAKFSHSFPCFIERLHSLDKMQTTVALHLVDAQRPSNQARFFFPGHLRSRTFIRPRCWRTCYAIGCNCIFLACPLIHH